MIDLVAFEHDRPFVIDALRQGEFDHLETVSEAAEADLFRNLIGRQILDRLAETYPTPRKKGSEREFVRSAELAGILALGPFGHFPRVPARSLLAV
jgi:hypothetical protein